MTTKPQIYAIGTCAIGIHASFLKILSIYYYFLFFLLNSLVRHSLGDGDCGKKNSTNNACPERSRIYPQGRNEQFKLFLQNKPNLLNAQINVSPVLIKNYEDDRTCSPRKSKPNKANLTQSKPNLTQFQKRPKMNVTKVLTKGYENIRLPSRAENKPNLSRRSPCLAIASCDGGWRSRNKPEKSWYWSQNL